MEYLHAQAPASIDDFYRIYSALGTNGLITLGYLDSLKGGKGAIYQFTMELPVVGNPADPLGSTFVRGHLDYSSHNLTTPPFLRAFLTGVSADCTGSVDLSNITATGCDFIARQQSVVGSSTPQLAATVVLVAFQ